MMDLESLIRAQRIMCLKKYIDDYTSAWKSFLSYYLEKVGGSSFCSAILIAVTCPYLCLGFTKTAWMPGPLSQGRKCILMKI